MADIGRPAALGAGAHPIAARRDRSAAITPFGKLESKRTRDWVCFGKPQCQPLSRPISFATLIADQGPRRFVVAEIFLAEVPCENQPVTAQILDRRKKA